MDDSIISVRNISKKFEEQYVLKNINVEFHKGNIYGLMPERFQ